MAVKNSQNRSNSILSRHCDIYLILIISFNVLQIQCQYNEKRFSVSEKLVPASKEAGSNLITNQTGKRLNLQSILIDKKSYSGNQKPRRKQRKKSRRESELQPDESRDEGYPLYDVGYGEEQLDTPTNLESNLTSPEDDEESGTNEPKFMESQSDNSNQTTSSSIVESEFSDENNDVERLVRNQVDFAATNWATLPPSNAHRTQSDEDSYNDLRDLNLNYQNTNFINNKTEDNSNAVYSQKVVSHEEPRNRIYPNHNYNSSYEDYFTTASTTGAPGGMILNFDIKPTDDPMTASSDRSNKYGSLDRYFTTREPTFGGITVTKKPSHNIEYMYRLRGPITDNYQPKRTTGQEAETILTRPKVQPTLSPRMTSVFQRLDQMNHANKKSDMEMTIYKQKTTDSIISNENGGISPLGYIDVPAVSNGQQIIIDHHDKDLSANGLNEAKNLISSSSQSNNLLSNSFKMGQTRLSNAFGTSTTVKPTTLRDNFSGNLAARLNANRNKNRKQISDQSSYTTSSVEPLIVNLQAKQHTTIPPSSRGAYKPMTTTSTTRSRIPLPLKPTTIKQPQTSTTLATASTTTTTTTISTVAPNLAQALLAASKPINKSKSERGVSGNLHSTRLAHHHHLHSHIHSIKPAVISIPVPIQSKFGRYDSLLAAAAAAAAAAARASANQRKPLLTQPLQMQPHPPKIPHPRSNSIMPLASLKLVSIPIGGKLQPSMRVSRNKFHKNSLEQPLTGGSETHHLPSHQSPSILSNFLDSANKAIKQVAGNTASLLDLQTSNSNQATSTIVDPLSKKSTKFTDATSAVSFSDPEDLYYPTQEITSLVETGLSPFESFALYQRPVDDSLNSPVNDYIESLLGASPETQQQDKLAFDPKPQPMEPKISSLNSEQKPQITSVQPSSIDWDVFNGYHQSLTPSVVGSAEGSGGIFPPATGPSNSVMYQQIVPDLSAEPLLVSNPIVEPQHSDGGQQTSSSAQGSLEDQSNFISAFDSPAWDKPSSINEQTTDGRSNKNNSDTKSRDKYSSNHIKAPYNQNNVKSFSDSGVQMQYALAHYIDHGQQSNSNNQNKNPYYDLFDHVDKPSATKYSVPYGIDFYTTDGSDGFRPVTPINYNYNAPNNTGYKYKQQTSNPSMITSNQQTFVYGSNNPYTTMKPKRKFINSARQSIRDQIQSSDSDHKSPGNSFYPTNGYNSNKNNIVYPTTTRHPFVQTQKQVQYLPFMPHYLLPHDAIHQALAGSDLRPHVMAANNLVNYHKQQLIDHHFMQHHYPYHPYHQYQDQDMKTSESARLGVAAPLKGSFLAHFWPLALALLPIMIIVAIVSQLIMAAPLVLFALTTLTMSRFVGTLMGPLLQTREDLGSFYSNKIHNFDSLVTKMPSQIFLTSLMSPNVSAHNEKNNSTLIESVSDSRKRKRRRRKRDIRYSTFHNSVFEEYFTKIKTNLGIQ